MKSHEDHIRAILATDGLDCDWRELRRLHGIRILRMQHERLIHLLVTLFCALFFLMTFFTALIWGITGLYAVSVLLLVLEIPYIIHYFRLENGVQRWYHLADKIDSRCGQESKRNDEMDDFANHS